MFVDAGVVRDPVRKMVLVDVGDGRCWRSTGVSIFVNLWCDPDLGTPLDIPENEEAVDRAKAAHGFFCSCCR